MRVGQRVAHLEGHAHGLGRGQRQQLREGAALHQLHHQEALALLVPEVVNPDDVRVVQQRQRPSLPGEAGLGLGTGGGLSGEELHRHRTVQPHVARAEDAAHATPADLLLQLQGADAPRVVHVLAQETAGTHRQALGVHRSPTAGAAATHRFNTRSSSASSASASSGPPTVSATSSRTNSR